jgi:AAA domain
MSAAAQPPSWLDHPFHVTFLKDHSGTEMFAETYTLRSLAPRVLAVTAKSKDSLPWLKAAKFGNLRTDKLSLRHDANVLTITGLEADYDGEQMPVADAVERLEKAGIAALAYTSPSHCEDAPRWRVLCPTSGELPPERGAELMGRLNGLFEGAFSSESWTLSQGFFYGSVNHNPSHAVHLIDGTPIDEHDELDEIWLEKSNTKKKTKANGKPATGTLDEAELLASITSGDNYHEACVRLLGRWALLGVPYMDARKRLLDAFDTVPASDRDARWKARVADVDRCLNSIYIAEARQKDQGKRQPEPPPHPGDAEPAGDWTNDPPPPGAEAGPSADEPRDRSHPNAALIAYLSVGTWINRDIPPADWLMGEIVSTTIKMFLVGQTGSGKTNLALAMALHIAAGLAFLHWKAGRPARVLFLDGEMPAELIKERCNDAQRRLGVTVPSGNLMIFGADIVEECARLFPDLPPFKPFNTEEGTFFARALIAMIGDVDLVIVDNVMSFVTGDQKDEVPWSDTLPLLAWLMSQSIGQVWLDHTGHNTTRQYGSSTKPWRFDTVGIITPLSDEQCEHGDLAFTLSFEPPGKTRRRTPANWRDYETCTIRLRDDVWTSDRTPAKAGKTAKLSPSRAIFHKSLIDAITVASIAPGSTTLTAWESESVRRGFIEPPEPGENSKARGTRLAKFRTAKTYLLAARWIGFDGQHVHDLLRDCSGRSHDGQ